MNVVDSSAWLEYFADGPNASFFAKPIQRTQDLIVPSLAIYEVFKRVLQQRNETDALRAFGATLWTQDNDFEGMPGVQYRERKG